VVLVGRGVGAAETEDSGDADGSGEAEGPPDPAGDSTARSGPLAVGEAAGEPPLIAGRTQT
jgi:hypothetical protein